ncbi:MAG: hypothetical protein ACREQ9_11085, partial [Candidatus Binatia bacterium]
PPRVARADTPKNDEFLARHLFPAEAAIAQLLIRDLPAAEIARRLGHSETFVVAKGVQIEKQLAARPETPPEILAAIRRYLARARQEP